MTRWLLSTTALLGLATIAHADTTRYFSRTACQANSAGDNGSIGRTNQGCFNTSGAPWPACSAPMLVVMPITGWQNPTVDYSYARVTVDKTNGAQLACSIAMTNASGTEYVSSVVSSTATGHFALFWDNAAGRVLPNAGAATANIRLQHMVCSIPGRQAGDISCAGSNNVYGYDVQTVNP